MLKKGTCGLARHGPREQRLARAGRPDQEDAAGQAGAELPVALAALEEVHDLRELGLRLVLRRPRPRR